MKPILKPVLQRQTAFTLIELLIVMAIIGVLVSLIFPVAGIIKKHKAFSVARAELTELETVIETYKNHVGYYPPDNPNNPMMNPLYFELSGTTNTSTITGGDTAALAFVTLDGSTTVDLPTLKLLYGVDGSGNARITGFANSSRSGRVTDEKAAPENFIVSYKPNQIGRMFTGTTNINALLVCSVGWHAPGNVQLLPTSGAPPYAIDPNLNPFRYVSTSPKHNTHAYDLWIDVVLGSTTNRISNWNGQPEVVSAP